MRPQRWRRLRRKVVYSFSFSQNKMDCSLTKTVSRRSESARELHLHGAPPATTMRSTECALCMYVYPALARTIVLAGGCHSQSTQMKRVNQMRIFICLAMLCACWKIHKTATNITHSHYSLTRSLVYSRRTLLQCTLSCRRHSQFKLLSDPVPIGNWIHFEPKSNMHEYAWVSAHWCRNIQMRLIELLLLPLWMLPYWVPHVP